MTKQPETQKTNDSTTKTRKKGDPRLRGPMDAPRGNVQRMFREFNTPGAMHPGLLPGFAIDDDDRRYQINWPVFGVAGIFVLVVILWAAVAPNSIIEVGSSALGWVTTNFGWWYSLLAVVVFVFMMIVGFGRTGGIRLGDDNEKPEFSTVSWVAMMFSAGIGIGLLFYGPYEPLTYFLTPPPGTQGAAGSVVAAQEALAQSLLHWGPIGWAFYALVGGAIAYGTYRRGRSGLISQIFDPIFKEKTKGILGPVVDVFAILVTLFGTSISLAIGALQIAQGTEIVTGLGPLGNGFILGTMAFLTAAFIVSAVSGVKRGIRILSNTNMVIAGLLAVFVLVSGPTLYLLNLIPAGIIEFFKDIGMMLVRNPNMGPEAADFMGAWTNYYWAWWIAWTPFVGFFIARISRGRTLREFVITVIIVPSVVSYIWFAIFGGSSMWVEAKTGSISSSGSSEAYLFALLDYLPGPMITTVFAMLSIIIFFVTTADSASLVMGSMSERGKPNPNIFITATWGLLMAGVAAYLLLAGGADALTGLQSMMVVSSLPFSIVVVGIMIAWGKELRTDPYVIRRKYSSVAISEGVRQGIEAFGDDFVFAAAVAPKDQGAGAWLDTKDPELTAWYTEAQQDAEEAAEEAVPEEESTAPDGEGAAPFDQNGADPNGQAPSSVPPHEPKDPTEDPHMPHGYTGGAS